MELGLLCWMELGFWSGQVRFGFGGVRSGVWELRFSFWVTDFSSGIKLLLIASDRVGCLRRAFANDGGIVVSVFCSVNCSSWV